MEKAEVLLILHLEKWPPDEVLKELIEEEAFQLRDYFLRNSVIHILYQSRIRKLMKLHEIKETFLESAGSFQEEKQRNEDLSGENLEGVLRFLEGELALQRGYMSTTLDPLKIAEYASEMIRVQGLYEQQLIICSENMGVSSSKEVVKAADQMNTAIALRHIKEQDEDQLKELLAKEMSRIQGLPKRR